MKFFKSKFFIICAAIALSIAIITSMMSVLGYSGILRSALKTVATPFEWCGTTVANAVNGFVGVFSEYDNLKEENEQLKAQLAELQDEKYENTVLREQNDWLKSYLDVKNYIPDVNITDATVIAHESGNYATVLTINKGYAHGIRKNMPVITEDGVFGSVSECGIDWAKVVSIVETASSVSVYTERAGVTGVVSGDTALRTDGYCIMTYIAANADIKVGDKIFTSGNGSIYPAGLLVGEVTEISADEATRTKSAVIKPSVDFNNTHDITKLMIVIGYASQVNP